MKKMTLKYSDFPEIKEEPSREEKTIEMINEGKKLHAPALAIYFKANRGAMRDMLARIEKQGKARSKPATVLSKETGKRINVRLYFK